MMAAQSVRAEPSLRADIDHFITRFGLTKTKFGLLAANSPQLVDNIRAGRGVGEKLERRIREFMDQGDPGIAVRSGRSVVRKQRATIARNMAQAQVDASFRMTDETEQAKTFLRQQHLVVFNAEIIDPRALGMFRIGIRTVSREQLIETARRHGWKQG
jgi:hypothetical protein